jgi:hypothetical protein
MSRLRDLP